MTSEQNLNVPKESRHCFSSSIPANKRLLGAGVKDEARVSSTRMQRVKRRARWVAKKILVFLLSDVGLTLLVGHYAVAGGFLFLHLETRNVEDKRSNLSNQSMELVIAESLKSIRYRYVDLIWNLTLTHNVLQPEVWKREVNTELQEYEKTVYTLTMQAVEVENKTDNSEQENANGWTYPRALLFAITVITTIGYGDTKLLAWQSKVVCMVYALIGVPLTLLCLTNIGSLLAVAYRFTWKHLSHLCLVIVRSPERNNAMKETSKVRVPVTASLTTMTVYIVGGAAIFSQWEGWSFLDGCYFCFITLSTIGFGDFVPGKHSATFESSAKRVVCGLYLLFGLALLSMTFQLMQDSVMVIVERWASLLGLSKSKIDDDVGDSMEHQEKMIEVKTSDE